MLNNFPSYYTVLTNWLLRLTFIWSVFLFSGYVANDFLTLPTVPETELIECQSPNPSISISQYYIDRLALQKQPSLFRFSSKVALIAYNRLQQTQFITLKKKRYTYAFSFSCLPIKIIPTNLTDLPPALC